MNGMTGIALTKLDVLTGFKKIPICTAYRYDGKLIHEFPASSKVMQHAEPVYEDLDGWDQPLDHVREFSDLPLRRKATYSESRKSSARRLFWFRWAPAGSRPSCSRIPFDE